MAERWVVFRDGDPKCLHPRVQGRQYVKQRPYEARVCLDCLRELRRPFTPSRVTMPKV